MNTIYMHSVLDLSTFQLHTSEDCGKSSTTTWQNTILLCRVAAGLLLNIIIQYKVQNVLFVLKYTVYHIEEKKTTFFNTTSLCACLVNYWLH